MTDTIADALEELQAAVLAEVGSHPITIESPGGMISARSNEPISQWRTFGTVELLTMVAAGGVTRSAEISDAEGIVSEVLYRIETSYLAGVTPRMRIQLPAPRARTLYIGGVHDIGNRGKQLVLYVGESLRT